MVEAVGEIAMAAITPTREQLIAQCQGLVRSLALKIQKGLPRQIELDDLISYGQIGLAEAARDFDDSRGGQFTTFAYYRIRGAIYDGVSKMAWVSRAHYNRMKYERMAADVLGLEQADQDPAAATLEQSLSWLKGISTALAVVYLSSHGDRDERDTLDVADSNAVEPQCEVIDRETCCRMHELIDQLPDECRSLIRATYFEGLTLTEAGQRLGIGKAWASRLHARALARLGRSLRLAGVAE